MIFHGFKGLGEVLEKIIFKAKVLSLSHFVGRVQDSAAEVIIIFSVLRQVFS
jgi:hypothetical protein